MLKLTPENVEEAIKKRFKNLITVLNGKEVRVGIKTGKTNNKGQDIAGYARANEFGVFSKGIPSRPFLRTTFNKDGQDDLSKRAFKSLSEVTLNDNDPDIALNKIAEHGAIMVRKNIRKGNWTPNKPATLARKKGSKPLIDTSAMIRSVEGWIADKNE